MSSASTRPPTPERSGSVSGAPNLPPGLDAFTSLMPDDRIELREGYAGEVGDVRLHYVEAGDGPLIVLLHGFPEFWFGWRLQIKPLAAAASESSHLTCAATTCHRGRPASRPTPPTGWPPMSAV